MGLTPPPPPPFEQKKCKNGILGHTYVQVNIKSIGRKRFARLSDNKAEIHVRKFFLYNL